MRSAGCVARLCLGASLALMVVCTAAGAARRPITGKLSRRGYTVIALASNGRTTAVRAPTGSFRLRPPAGTVTLQLRAANGLYAGPVVVGHQGTRDIVGVNAGARLGRVNVNVRRGYATTSRRLSGGSVDARRWARARHGVPIGAGNFGRVRSRLGRPAVPGDLDRDGVPNVIDIDDDGDLILDNLDHSRRARATQSGSGIFGSHFDLEMTLDQTANADAGSTDQQIEAALPTFGRLDLQILPGGSAELDCGRPQSRTDPTLGGLTYCTKGGTGQIPTSLPGPGIPVMYAPFPDCCDADGDGFGTLTKSPGSPEPAVMLRTRADTAHIGTGDVLIQWVANGVPASQCPPASGSCASYLTTLQYVFATVPALVSYSDGQGDSATVSYPVAAPDPGTGRGGGPGTRENPFPVRAGPNGDVVVTLTFWRPQRRPIGTETGTWIDIGGLNYIAGIADVDLRCQQSAFSENDPNLALPTTSTLEGGGFTDLATDQPASPVNTLTYTLNLSACLRSPVDHAPTPSLSFDPGETRGFKFSAVSADQASGGGESSEAEQPVFFKRQ